MLDLVPARGRTCLPERVHTILTIHQAILQRAGAETVTAVTKAAPHLNLTLFWTLKTDIRVTGPLSLSLFPIWPQRTNLLFLIFLIVCLFNWHIEDM